MSSAFWTVTVAGLGVGFLIGWLLNAFLGRNSTRKARSQSRSLMDETQARTESLMSEMREAFEAEQEERLAREEAARSVEDARLREREKAMAKRERGLSNRDRDLSGRDKALKKRETKLEAGLQEIDKRSRAVVDQEQEIARRMEHVAGLTREEARRQLLAGLRAEVRFEAAGEIKRIKDEAQRRAEDEARMIMSLAMERLASDYSAERSVSYVALPDQAFKGRIIGSEGKNIRAFEKESGMQLIVDDNPNQVSISGFNPVRREVARRALERLIKEGNIYPKRIASVVGSTRRKLEEEMRKAGEEAVAEFGLRRVHPELVALLGRLKHRTSYSQNVLEHVKECAYLCGIMAAELDLDQKLAQRAALLHDIGKAVDYEREGTHPEIGAEIAQRFKESAVVVNAIASHHEDCEVISPISVLVATADALSGARPGARRRATVDYIQRIEKLEELAGSYDGVSSCYALRAGREIRVICTNGGIDDARTALLASDLAKRIETEMDYPGKVKVTVIREVRAVEYAR